ncbi:plastid-specific 50S ribosomal protein 6 [Actinidia rufa]|uniref:Plastid-specific 50S ribosomal protein 6 n=1 Tax=Actinidia rufa TaxID=165716 RepID=A0A7J0DWG5_9ERIC|nr:plastid-specific 50S ribosomal protein 6 [Actinidia rufa]
MSVSAIIGSPENRRRRRRTGDRVLVEAAEEGDGAPHMKTRPRKTQPWDIRRKPAVYPPLPPLPAEWSFAPADDSVAAAQPPPQLKSE